LYHPPCKALYLRGWVYNFGVSEARDCSVFIKRVRFEGKILDDDRSPLAWTDIDTFDPQTIARGLDRGRYVDICASDQNHPVLQIKSQKATKGYGVYAKSGLYTLELTAEVPSRAGSFEDMEISLLFNGRWDGIEAQSVKPRRKHLRIW
jgi:hypothetical protein